jgi:hypothetical protein
MKKKEAKKTVRMMNIDVILTFRNWDNFDSSQEWFNFDLEVKEDSPNAVKFFDEHVFEIISAACADLGRDPADMWKISTSSTWKDYTEVTGNESLTELGHNCKWIFDSELCELDNWEKALMKKYSFGANL